MRSKTKARRYVPKEGDLVLVVDEGDLVWTIDAIITPKQGGRTGAIVSLPGETRVMSVGLDELKPANVVPVTVMLYVKRPARKGAKRA